MNATQRNILNRGIVQLAPAATALAQKIHAWSEPPFRETRSARATADFLAEHGFEVAFAFPNIPTAFRARRGAGRPVIGMLGEYDALPDCGAAPGQWGHGCGHHLLGTGAAAGAVAAAELLAATRRKGTIVYYGCPAEEILAGKAYMARDGAFAELDVCLGWHPQSRTMPRNLGGAAMDSIMLEFFGKTAHGSYAANGRSAADAAVLCDVAVNYLREHVPDNVRIHAAILDAGTSPNVVPAYARIWYYVRGLDRRQVDEICRRLLRCARGAAMATETRVKSTRLAAIHPRLPNDTLCDVIETVLNEIGPPRPTAADRRRARQAGTQGEYNLQVGRRGAQPGMGSSDQDTVSQLTPFASFNMTCEPKGTLGHHRQRHELSNHPFAYRGMMQAAKVMAATAARLASDPGLVRKIRAEYRRRNGGKPFDPLLPKRQRIPDNLW